MIDQKAGRSVLHKISLWMSAQPGNLLLVAIRYFLGYHCIAMHLYVERKEDPFMDTWNLLQVCCDFDCCIFETVIVVG